MTYQNVWWYPNYINYNSDVNCTPKRWPKPPGSDEGSLPAFHDKRFFSAPTDMFEERLYYTILPIGYPQSRQLMEKPHKIPKRFPDVCTKAHPAGFHGRVYHESGPPGFKYDGPKKDEFFWYEKNPYMPKTEDHRLQSTRRMDISWTETEQKKPDLELYSDGPDSKVCGCMDNTLPAIIPIHDQGSRFVRLDKVDTIKKQTIDGVGLL